jgi:hypothetical protein
MNRTTRLAHRTRRIVGAAVMLFAVLVLAQDQAKAQNFWASNSTNNINNTNTGNVGINITNPLATLHVVAATNPGFYFDAYQSSTAVPNIRFRWANGSPSGPMPVALGDQLGKIGFAGYAAGSPAGFTGVASANITVYASEAYTGTGQGAYLTFWTTATGSPAAALAERVRIDPFGRVGIGTTNPQRPLHLVGSDGAAPSFPTIGAKDMLVVENNNNSNLALVGAQNAVTGLKFYQSGGTSEDGQVGYNHQGQFLYFNVNGGFERMRIDPSGNLGIGTISPVAKLDVNGNANVSGNETVTGNLTVTGNIAAKYQDVAEWVPASQSISVGAVVVLDRSHTNLVMPSAKPYDTSVAGVISANPGVALGEAGDGKVLVATTGRVKVRVDATSAPIAVGDLLVTSDKPGMAMKSQPIDVGGTQIHRPGTLIGKALEPLSSGQGEILVLLALQ